jgi:hypothetical protein
MTEHPNEVIADDNAGTLRAIESTRQLKAPLRNRRRVRSTYRTATPPKITVVKPHSQKVHECVT